MPKITTKWDLNLKEKEVVAKVNKANKSGMLITIVAIANDSIKDSPKLTGHNARSIKYEVGPFGEIAKKENSRFNGKLLLDYCITALKMSHIIQKSFHDIISTQMTLNPLKT